MIYTNLFKNVHINNGILQIKPIVADDEYGQGFVYLPNGLDLGLKYVQHSLRVFIYSILL